MRILIGSLYHESNSFNPITTEKKDFTVFYGDEIYDHLRENDSLTGIIDTLKDHELLTSLSARAIPNGEVSQSFYNELKTYIHHQIDNYLEDGIDAVCLALHGSMRIVGIGDAEGDLLESIRLKLPSTPIHIALDMHTTMTEKMFNNSDSFVGYKCAPHTDCYETGVHAATTLLEHTREALMMTWIKIPALIAGEKSETNNEPMISLIQHTRDLEKEASIVSASYLMGFPWSDNSDASAAVLIVSKQDCSLQALDMARFFWSKREQFKFHTETFAPEIAISKSLAYIAKGIRPVYLSDSGDNPTAGSTGDHTQLLSLLLDLSYEFKEPVIYGGIYDPLALKKCENKVGDSITLTIGGSYDPKAKPLTLFGKVITYIKDWSIGGYFKSDVALFRCGSIDIVLNENHIGYITPDLFKDLSRDPRSAELVVCKLGYLTEGHRQVASKSIMALTKGSTDEWIEKLPYEKVVRPIFPLDHVDYQPEKYLKIKTSKSRFNVT